MNDEHRSDMEGETQSISRPVRWDLWFGPFILLSMVLLPVAFPRVVGPLPFPLLLSPNPALAVLAWASLVLLPLVFYVTSRYVVAVFFNVRLAHTEARLGVWVGLGFVVNHGLIYPRLEPFLMGLSILLAAFAAGWGCRHADPQGRSAFIRWCRTGKFHQIGGRVFRSRFYAVFVGFANFAAVGAIASAYDWNVWIMLLAMVGAFCAGTFSAAATPRLLDRIVRNE